MISSFPGFGEDTVLGLRLVTLAPANGGGVGWLDGLCVPCGVMAAGGFGGTGRLGEKGRLRLAGDGDRESREGLRACFTRRKPPCIILRTPLRGGSSGGGREDIRIMVMGEIRSAI